MTTGLNNGVCRLGRLRFNRFAFDSLALKSLAFDSLAFDRLGLRGALSRLDLGRPFGRSRLDQGTLGNALRLDAGLGNGGGLRRWLLGLDTDLGIDLRLARNF